MRMGDFDDEAMATICQMRVKPCVPRENIFTF